MYSSTPGSQPPPKQARPQPAQYQSQQPPAYNYPHQGYGPMGQVGPMAGGGMAPMDNRSMQPMDTRNMQQHQQNMGTMMGRQMGQQPTGPVQMPSHGLGMENRSMNNGQMPNMGSQPQVATNQRPVDNRTMVPPGMENHHMGQLGNNQMSTMNNSMNSSMNSSMNNSMSNPMGSMGAMMDRPMGVPQHQMTPQMGQHQQQQSSSNPANNQQMQRMMTPAYTQQEKQRMEQYQRQQMQHQSQMQNYQSHMQHAQVQAQAPVQAPVQAPAKPPPKNNSRRKRTVNKAQLDEQVTPNYHFQPPPSYGYQQNNNMIGGHQMSGHQMAAGQQLQHHSMMHGAPGGSQSQYPNTKSSEMVRLELRNSIQAKQQQQKQKEQPQVEQQHRIPPAQQAPMQRPMQQDPSMMMGNHMGQYQYGQMGQSQPPQYHQSSSMGNNLSSSMGQGPQMGQPHPQQMQEMGTFNTPQVQGQINQNTPISSVASTSSASSLDFPNELGFFDMQDPELPVSCDKLEENLKSLTVHDFAILGRCAFDFSNQQTIDFVRQILLM